MILWEYVIESWSLFHNTIPRPLFQNKEINLHEETLGASSDIINLCVYGWYEWNYYCYHDALPANREELGRLLSPIKNEGNQMAQYILANTVTVVISQTQPKLQKSDLICDYEESKCNLFDGNI